MLSLSWSELKLFHSNARDIELLGLRFTRRTSYLGMGFFDAAQYDLSSDTDTENAIHADTTI